jgi:hypothetical protein
MFCYNNVDFTIKKTSKSVVFQANTELLLHPDGLPSVISKY